MENLALTQEMTTQLVLLGCVLMLVAGGLAAALCYHFRSRIKLIEKYYDVLSYLIFGVLTTIVNYLVYIPVYNMLGLSAAVSNIIAWVVAVAFAYLTNKPFVFLSHDWSAKTVIPELTKFVSCRVASGAMETVILLVTVDLLGWNGNIWKLVTSVLVVVLNYFASKLLVFKKK